jgi:integrase
VLVAVLTGLRIGEILALRWKRIDLLGSTIEVAENYSCGEFVSPKTKSSRRVIPISAALAGVFKTLRMESGQSSELESVVHAKVQANPQLIFGRSSAILRVPSAVGFTAKESRIVSMQNRTR